MGKLIDAMQQKHGRDIGNGYLKEEKDRLLRGDT